jgi:glycosyltransferase involved in cell wall biosynthesis
MDFPHVVPIIYSVVICSYNKIGSLPIVVEGLRKTNRYLELILVDDGSTDGTVEWAKSSGIFSHVHSESGPGKYRMSTLRNIGVSLSSSEFVVLFDADCVPTETHFLGHDFVFGMSSDLISVGRRVYYSSDNKDLIGGDDRRSIFCDREVCSVPYFATYSFNLAFKKETFEKIGGFDTSFDGEWGVEDIDFAFRSQSVCDRLSHRLSEVHHLDHKSCAKNGGDRNIQKFEKKHGFQLIKR